MPGRVEATKSIEVPRRKRVTVPFHGAKILHPEVLKSVLTEADLTADELQDLMI